MSTTSILAADKVAVVGAGPGGATAAMVLAQAGWHVVLFEKGRDHFTDLDQPVPGTQFSNDELKKRRGFGRADTSLEPRTLRWTERDTEPVATGDVNHVPQGIGGGTSQWDAKTPRFWDLDFAKHELLGPIDGADVTDWPFTYDEIEPRYAEAERLLGVAGDAGALAETVVGRHAPRSGPFPMPPGPPMHSSLLLAAGAASLGLHPVPFPMAIASQAYDGRPPCIGCGHCSGFGCPIHDRGSALIPLRHALATGRLDLRTESMVIEVVHDGRKATGVRWRDGNGDDHTEDVAAVVLAANPIETIRLALRSSLPDRSERLGRCLMFHWFTTGFGIWLDHRVHANRGRDTSHSVDDFCDPDFTGARAHAKDNGLPYFRGGVVEMGGAPTPMDEAMQYVDLMKTFDAAKPFGRRFKELMRLSALRDRLAGAQMIAEDLAQVTNMVDLDPTVTDRYGLPVPRITYRPHHHELVAQDFYRPKLAEMMKAAGADVSGAIAETGTLDRPSPTGSVTPGGYHVLGGMRMGADAATSVTDDHGRLWGLDNVWVADGSVFPTSGAHNPTLTIVATTLRNARAWAGVPADGGVAPTGADDARDDTDRGGDGRDSDSGVLPWLAGATAAAATAVAATTAVRRRSRSTARSASSADRSGHNDEEEPSSS